MFSQSQQTHNENQIISNVMSFSENTMGAVVSASIGKVLLMLREKYIGTGSLNQLNKAFEEAYAPCLAEISAFAKSAEQQAALAFIRAKVEESFHYSLDTFTVYDPDKKEYKTHDFPLKHVLILVWKAINDTDAYHDNIDDPKAREERIATFFKTLMRMRDDPVCHHGNRNELVFMLNLSYPGVNIIEDARFAIYTYLKKNIFKAFDQAYHDEKRDKQELKSALFTWMQESKPGALIKLIHPNLHKELVAGINQLLIQHGTNPENEDIKQFIAHALSKELEFYCNDKRYPGYSYAYRLLKEISDPNQPERTDALEFMQTWMVNSYQLGLEDNKVASFYMMYFTHKKIMQHQVLFKLCGKWSDEIITFIEHSNLYFKSLAKEKTFPQIAPETIKLIQGSSKLIDETKKDNLAHAIENFFSNWFLAEKKDKSTLYRNMLYTPAVLNKIEISDVDIRSFVASASPSTLEKDITPFEINRIFLHAIIKNPTDWSKEFYAAFKLVLDFVKRNFSNQDQIDHHANQLAIALKRDSYPNELLKQLNYLGDRYEVLVNEKQETVKRPTTPMILLPDQVKTPDEWIKLSEIIRASAPLWEEIYRSRKVYLENMFLRESDICMMFLSESHTHRLLTILDNIPPAFVNGFALDKRLKKWVNDAIKNDYQLSQFLDRLAAENYVEFLQMLEKDVLIKIITGNYRISLVLDKLPEKNRLEFLRFLGNDALIAIIKNGHQLADVLKKLPKEDRAEFFQWIGSDALKIMIKHGQLASVLTRLPKANRIELFHTLEKDELKDIMDADALYVVLCDLSRANQAAFLKSLGIGILTMIIGDNKKLQNLQYKVSKNILDMLPSQALMQFKETVAEIVTTYKNNQQNNLSSNMGLFAKGKQYTMIGSLKEKMINSVNQALSNKCHPSDIRQILDVVECNQVIDHKRLQKKTTSTRDKIDKLLCDTRLSLLDYNL